MEIPILAWTGFLLFILLMLALDLGVFHRHAHVVSIREAFVWSVVWVVLALGFNVGIYFWLGGEKALAFLTGYLIEKSLSIDNVFVFAMIFGMLGTPSIYQHKVLFWGVLGALVMRAICIAAGVSLLHHFHWMIYIFGGILLFTAIKMVLDKSKEKMDPEKNRMLRLFRWIFPATSQYHGEAFWIVEGGKRLATPLLLALLLVEATDVVFAVDSIPAILAITSDPFIVFTSNVFAILGLRSLYFALAGLIDAFRYLHYGLAGVLGFVGCKMMLADFYKVPPLVALGVIAGMLLLSIALSLLARQEEKPASEPAADTPR